MGEKKCSNIIFKGVSEKLSNSFKKVQMSNVMDSHNRLDKIQSSLSRNP